MENRFAKLAITSWISEIQLIYVHAILIARAMVTQREGLKRKCEDTCFLSALTLSMGLLSKNPLFTAIALFAAKHNGGFEQLKETMVYLSMRTQQKASRNIPTGHILHVYTI